MPGGGGPAPKERTAGCGGGVRPWLPASPAALAGVQREHLAGDGAERERPGVARARPRGPERAAPRPWRWLRRARAAMGLLRLMALAALASQPGVAGGAETVGNSSVGKVGAPPFCTPRGFCIISCKVEVHPRVCAPSSRGGEFRAGRKGSGSFVQKEIPFAKEASSSLRLWTWEEMRDSLVHTHSCCPRGAAMFVGSI